MFVSIAAFMCVHVGENIFIIMFSVRRKSLLFKFNFRTKLISASNMTNRDVVETVQKERFQGIRIS